MAKADGDAPVQAYIEAMPGWKRDLGRRLDALIVRSVPNVRKAREVELTLLWHRGPRLAPGVARLHPLRQSGLFKGTSLRPVPPGGTGKESRWIDIHEDDLDEVQMASWVKQAAAILGWGKS